MLQLFGIKNCDSVKKASTWLQAHDSAFKLHDYKIDGITEEHLQSWIEQVGWETLVNKRSATWRTLSSEEKSALDENTVIPILCQHPTLIKRPVLQFQDQLLVGFQENRYQQLFR